MGGENGAYSQYEYTNVFAFNGVNWTEVNGLPIESVNAKSSALGNNLYYIGGTRNSGSTIFTNVYMGTEFFIPIKPINPIPTNTAIHQHTNTTVSWQDGGYATGYIINFGISNAMTNCGSTATTNYNPGLLLYGSNYQWRIDATNTTGITTGDVWSFTVRDIGNWYVSTNGTGMGTSWEDAINDLPEAAASCPSNYTVWVSNGIYTTTNTIIDIYQDYNFITIGGGVTVRSKSGLPSDVILNGNAGGRVVKIIANGQLIGCTVTNGRTEFSDFNGAGVTGGSISNCIVSGCWTYNGGGLSYCSAYNSTISYNSATDGGGARWASLYNCLVKGNTTTANGAGGINCTFWNCLIIENSATAGGGGNVFSVNYNCTISGNSAGTTGGGCFRSTQINTISWNNNKVDTWVAGWSNFYSCGVGYTSSGSITNDPLFVSTNDFLLQTNSPCWNTGINSGWIGITNSVDLDGNQRIWPFGGIVDMGAYEYGSQTNYPIFKPINPIPINGSINQLTNTVVSWENGGNTIGYIINFGISNAMTNCGSTTTTNYNPGVLLPRTDYQWRIDATNTTGITTGDVWSFTTTNGDWYVATNGIGKGRSWVDATNNLQGAITSCPSNYTVWVSNGTYIGNFIVGFGITVRSRTGIPTDVILNGNAADRVVTMGNAKPSYGPNSWIIGMTITNGNIGGGSVGGGVYGGTVSNCIIIGNIADNGGGGAGWSMLYNCIINGNTTPGWDGTYGGGAGWYCDFYNCTISQNTAPHGGGGWACTLKNSISWGNSTTELGCSESYSCGVGYTGTGSITNNPLFVSASDFRLQNNSPCIDKGNNAAWAELSNSVDLDGNPRIWPVGTGIVDMGAYELKYGNYFLWVKP
jgi:hypothetical protein